MDVQFKWTYVEKESFEKFKVSIGTSLALQNPYLSREFLLYSFASNHSLAKMLTQKYEQCNESPISFMRTSLLGVEMNYPAMDKKGFYVHKYIK
jgi:hypothetical protein